MASMSEFYTREAGNQGVKLPLTLPSGEKTDQFLVVRSIDSDAFREASADAKREVIRAAQVDDLQERRKMARESTLNMQVSLVKDWSFDEECTPENVRSFLIGAPHIADALDQMCSQRELFFEKKSDSSGNSQDTNLT